jgi:hypothetical protein
MVAKLVAGELLPDAKLLTASGAAVVETAVPIMAESVNA